MSFSLGELAASLGATVQGDAGLIVKSIAPLDQAGADQLAFLSNPLYLNQAVSSGAGAIIVSPRDLETLESQGHAAGRNWLIAANPYAAFAPSRHRTPISTLVTPCFLIWNTDKGLHSVGLVSIVRATHLCFAFPFLCKASSSGNLSPFKVSKAPVKNSS